MLAANATVFAFATSRLEGYYCTAVPEDWACGEPDSLLARFCGDLGPEVDGEAFSQCQKRYAIVTAVSMRTAAVCPTSHRPHTLILLPPQCHLHAAALPLVLLP